jgi:hypothetical protein
VTLTGSLSPPVTTSSGALLNFSACDVNALYCAQEVTRSSGCESAYVRVRAVEGSTYNTPKDFTEYLGLSISSRLQT